MSINKAYEQYKKVDLQTAPQTKLVVMMYDGAIKFLENALVSLDKKHGTEEAHKNIVKAQEIVCELLVSLNYDAGEIADRLAAIYTYMNQKLTEGNISKKKPPIIEVLKYLKELRAAWESAEHNYTKQQVSPSTTTTSPTNKIDTKPINSTTPETNNQSSEIEKNVAEKKENSNNSKLNKYGAGKTTSSGKLNISG